jgi:hypothetical protein
MLRARMPHRASEAHTLAAVLEAARGHPLGSRKVALPDLPAALRVLLDIEVQHNLGDLPPVCSVYVGIE